MNFKRNAGSRMPRRRRAYNHALRHIETLEQRVLMSLVAYEGFSYTGGTLLINVPPGGGTGWTSNWAEFTNIPSEKENDNINATGLLYGNGGFQLATNGGSLNATGITSDDVRTFSSQSNLVTYFSFLIRHETVGSAIPSEDYGGMAINGNIGGSDYFVGDPGESGFISVGKAGTGASLVQSTVPMPVGTTQAEVVFLVARVALNPVTNNDQVRLYINPVPGSTEVSNMANSIFKGNLDIGTAITGIELLSGNFANWRFDEVRVGTTFADVTPLQPGPVVTATDGTNASAVQLSWGAVSGALGYDVYRSTSPNPATATKLNPSLLGTTSFTDTTANPGTIYFYWAVTTTNLGIGTFGVNPEGGYRTPVVAGTLNLGTSTNTDSYYLNVSGGSTLQISFGTAPLAPPTYTIPMASLTSLTINLTGTTNKVYVSYSGGSPVPTGGLHIVSNGAAGNELRVLGLNGAQSFTLSDTQIGLTGGNPITFSSLNTLSLGTMSANYPGGTLSTLQNLNLTTGATLFWGSAGSFTAGINPDDLSRALAVEMSPEPTTTPTATDSPISGPVTSPTPDTTTEDEKSKHEIKLDKKFPAIHKRPALHASLTRGTSWHGDHTAVTRADLDDLLGEAITLLR